MVTKKYKVECIGQPRTEFGDSLDSKCDGSILEKESKLTEEHGFSDDRVGYASNPLDFIHRWEETGRKPKDMAF